MEIILQITGLVFLVLGTLLSVIGIIGFVRLPDAYTRLHATGKVSVFGLVFLLIAADILTPLATWKALLLIFFALMASPSVSHTISSAAYKLGVPMTGKRDDLKIRLERGSGRQN